MISSSNGKRLLGGKCTGKYPHPLSLEDWWRSKGEDEKAEWWRHRETISDPPKREESGEEVSNSYEQERSYGPSL
jgi:hypothetical protein